MSAALLSVTGLGVAYAGAPALADVSFAVGRGETVAVVGPNGAGKSTLLRAVMGLVPTDPGSVVTFAGTSLAGLSAHRRARRGIAYVPEGRRIFAGMTVRENLEVASFGGPAARAAAVDCVFALFPQLAGRAGETGWRLSGGQQQMLSIGRALMADPALLLMDEPSLGLAPLVARDVFAALREIAGRGTAILLAEQNARSALSVASRGIVLRRGRVVQEAPAAGLAAALGISGPGGPMPPAATLKA